MRLYVTHGIRELVSKGQQSSSHDSSATPTCDNDEPRDHGSIGDTIEWDELKRLYNSSDYAQMGISLEDVCRGSGICTGEQPKVCSTKSPQLVKHLADLQIALDQKRYDEMVRCVTSKEKAWKNSTGFHSYKEQMRYGAHVISMMAVFFSFGYAVGWRLFDSMAYRAVCGIISMFIAMVLECILFILRFSKDMPSRVATKMNIPTGLNSVDKAKVE